jgi:hypothetical protein
LTTTFVLPTPPFPDVMATVCHSTGIRTETFGHLDQSLSLIHNLPPLLPNKPSNLLATLLG